MGHDCSKCKSSKRKALLLSIILVITTAQLSNAGALIAVPAELEGRITAIEIASGPLGINNLGVSSNKLSVMGVEVWIPNGMTIHTPVAALSFSELLGDSFPGRDEAGFMGGTAIIEAETINGVTMAMHVFVEPSENVLIGAVTDNANGTLSILGLEVQLIDDYRMLGVAMTENGFLVDLTTTEPGSFAVAEGYFGNDNVFHAFAIEAVGEILGPPNQTSITRARCDIDGSFDVRGASTSDFGIIDIYDADTLEYLGSTIVDPDEDNPPFGKYRYDVDDIGECPMRILVENSNGSHAFADVDID